MKWLQMLLESQSAHFLHFRLNYYYIYIQIDGLTKTASMLSEKLTQGVIYAFTKKHHLTVVKVF